MGLKADPDRFPQADGVKLWEPTYAHPTGDSTTSISSSSVSESKSESRLFWPFPDEASRNVAIIILGIPVVIRISALQ